ncbi:MAG: hypothetical protein R3C14_14760 [Caldilineaceae bacterium]
MAGLLRTRLQEIRMPIEIQEYLLHYPDVLNLAILVSEDAPETPILLPLWVRIAQAAPRFELRIFRDVDELSLLEWMAEELELTEAVDNLELPLGLIFDEEWNFQLQWGPHPAAAEPYLDQWFAQHPEYEVLAEDEGTEAQARYGVLLDDLIQQMRVWYNSELNKVCLQEILEALIALQGAEDENEE